MPPAAEQPSAAPADTSANADTGTAAAAQPAGQSGAQSPQAIALGDSIFHGQVAGAACTACHGQDAKGTPMAPDLTDAEWINTDGSFEGIVKVVTEGVPQPKQHPAPMPPKGGATIDDAQVRAVAAYVYSLSHKS
jgi:mono/diheme cytochrome c family protein